MFLFLPYSTKTHKNQSYQWWISVKILHGYCKIGHPINSTVTNNQNQSKTITKTQKRKSEKETEKPTIAAPLEDITLHLEVDVFGAQVDMGGQHHLDIFLLLWELRRRGGGGVFHACLLALAFLWGERETVKNPSLPLWAMWVRGVEQNIRESGTWVLHLGFRSNT